MVGDETPDVDEDSLPELPSSYAGGRPTDYDSLREGLPPQIIDGVDEKSGGYSPNQVYAANGVRDAFLEPETWEVESVVGEQAKLEAFA